MRYILILLFMSVTGMAFAQNIALIDGQKIISQIPQREDFEKKLEQEFKPVQQDLEAGQKKLQTKGRELEKQRLTLKAEEVEKREEELRTLQESLQRKARLAQQDFQARQEEINGQIELLIQDAIGVVAKKEGFEVVLFRGAVAWSGVDVKDITSLVVTYLSEQGAQKKQ